MPSFNYMSGVLPSNNTLTRASSGTRINSSGTFVIETNDVARFTYDPASLALRGLLVEPSRTNLVANSQNASGWAQVSCSFSGGVYVSPDGTQGAPQVTATIGANVHNMFKLTAVTNSTAFSISGYLRQDAGRYLGFVNGQNSFGLCIVIDGTNGSVVETSGSNGNYAVDNGGGGWYRGRIEGIVGPNSATDFFIEMGCAGAPGANTYNGYSEPSFTAAGTETIGMWGAQVEIGAQASSLIPTTTPVTRAADVLSISSAGVPNGTYDITITRASGATFLPGTVVAGGYTVPTDVSPLQTISFDTYSGLMGQAAL